MTLIECLCDLNLFGRHFRNASWSAWKVFLRALFAESSDAGDLEVYRELTGRAAWPGSPFSESVLIVGRRGGKSRILALIATYLAVMRDHGPHLAAGEVATIAVLAMDRGQARAIFRFVLGFLRSSPLFEELIVRRDSETIELRNRVTIEITTASFRSTRGYSFAAVLADEVAFWHSDEASANPDVEILRALRPGLASIPGSMLLIASSPYGKKGELYNSFRRYYGQDNARVLVWKAPTLVMNPALDKRVVEEAFESDPEAARAEYGGEFRDDLADYVTREQVDRLTIPDRHGLPPMSGVAYSAFIDPSGGVGDSMALAIGHLGSKAVCILDVILEIRAPFDPEPAVKQCAELLRRYGVSSAGSDYYAAEWVASRFRENGIELVRSSKPKSDLFLNLLPLIVTGRAELLDLPRLSAQLCGLERRTSRSGRDTVDHVRGAHDDVANCVAGLLVALDLDRRPAMVDLKQVTGGEGGFAEPSWHQYAFAMIVDAGPDVAVVYCGSDVNDYGQGSPTRLYVADADTAYFRPGLWDEIRGRLGAMRATRRFFLAPEPLAASLARLGVPAEALPKGFDPEPLVTFASECIGRGLVRFCATVVEKMKTQTIGAAMALKAGDEVEGALRSALIGAIWAKFANV
jgi:hypothetical protein